MPPLRQDLLLLALPCLAGLRRVMHELIVQQTLRHLNRRLQTPCTASARKSMTGVGKSSWSCPRCWRASLWPTHWSSRPRSRSSGQRKAYPWHHAGATVLASLAKGAGVSWHRLLVFCCTASPGRHIWLYSENIVEQLAFTRVPQPDQQRPAVRAQGVWASRLMRDKGWAMAPACLACRRPQCTHLNSCR